jgi:hypothetical protein
MDDKKVILSKSEFDKMEADLNDFAAIIESKTVCRIAYPKLTWNTMYSKGEIGTYEVDYVVGCDENEVVNELGAEITKLQEDKEALNHVVDGLEANLRWYQNQEDNWKNLPWYKRLFV